jgi:hypothetical protein
MKKKIRQSLLKGIFVLSLLSLLAFSQKTELLSARKPTKTAILTPPGTVTGVVKNAQGKPIAGAKVRIENDFAYYDVTTNAKGQYSCYVRSIGSFKAVAWASIPYLGKNYNLRMGMPDEADYDFFDPRGGAIRNFQLQVSGSIPDRSDSYFGFTLSLNNTGSIYTGLFLKPGETVDVILVPDGPLLDGSVGEKIERQATVPNMNESIKIDDIPLGKYKAYAYVDRNGAWQRLRIGASSTELREAMDVLPLASSDRTGNYDGPNSVKAYVGGW